MLQTAIAALVLIAIWIISTQRKLVGLDEKVNNAMNQIGVQFSSRFDALVALLELTKGYARHESNILIEIVKSRRSVISAKSTPDDVVGQERAISEVLGRITTVVEQYPELKENQNYLKAMDALEIYENMIRTSCLIYNESVNKLNREVRMFPVSMVAGILGFRKKDYVERGNASFSDKNLTQRKINYLKFEK